MLDYELKYSFIFLGQAAQAIYTARRSTEEAFQEGSDFLVAYFWALLMRILRRQLMLSLFFARVQIVAVWKLTIFFYVSLCRQSVPALKKDCRHILKYCHLSSKPLWRPLLKAIQKFFSEIWKKSWWGHELLRTNC